MYAIILEGTEAFVKDAMNELSLKNMRPIGNNVVVGTGISGFDTTVTGLKNLASYKKGTNKIYKTSALTNG